MSVESNPRPEQSRRSISAEAIIAVSALIVSVVSLGVGIYQGYLNAQMVAAASWPYLTFESGNVSDDGKLSQLTFTIVNGGVGPARIQTFQLFFNGMPVGDLPDLVKACCSLDLRERMQSEGVERAAEKYGLPTTITPTGKVIPAGTDRTFIGWEKPDLEENAVYWRQLDKSRFGKITAAACYCSVLGDCWFTDFRAPEPQKVQACPPVKGPQFSG